MASRRRHLRHRRSFNMARPIAIRVFSRHSPRRFYEVQVSGPRDAGRFARLVEDQVRESPRDPLIIAVNGYEPWLEDIFRTVLEDYWSDISDLDREVQFAGTMQFPEKSNDTHHQNVPWTFIVNHMNVPQVYYWSVGMEPPPADDYGLPNIYDFRFRVGAWKVCQGGCLIDPSVPVSIIFTQDTPVCEHVVTELLFPFLMKDSDFTRPQEDEEGICWLFMRLYWLLTDWQNIIKEIYMRLKEAERNSHGRQARRLPVKLRARLMHKEVDRIYDMREILHYHSRAFKKLQKLKDDVPKKDQKDAIWDDLDDCIGDLDQYDSTTDSLKDRFNNLLDLEFNIQSAVQADNGQFLSIIATLFLPVSFVASVFGITTVNWPVIWYLYVAVPVVVVSAAFTAVFPWSVQKYQKWRFPVENYIEPLYPEEFTMLGDELPDSADAPGGMKSGGGKRRSQKPSGVEDRPRSRVRSRSRARSEKRD